MRGTRGPTAAGSIACQPLSHPQFQQRRPATTRSFPLPPQSRLSRNRTQRVSRSALRAFRRSRNSLASPVYTEPVPPSSSLMLTPLALTRDLPDSSLEPFQSLRRYNALDLRPGVEAESEKLPLLRSRHRTLRLIHLELELLRDESRDALHHPLTRPLAANVDITVIRISNEAMSTALQLSVEFVEHEIA